MGSHRAAHAALDERGGATVVSIGGYGEGRTKGIPGAFVVFVSRVSLEGSPIRLSPHMDRTMRLPIILHTGNTQVLRPVGKVVSLYHKAHVATYMVLHVVLQSSGAMLALQRRHAY
jgi:hypothetical protein